MNTGWQYKLEFHCLLNKWASADYTQGVWLFLLRPRALQGKRKRRGWMSWGSSKLKTSQTRSRNTLRDCPGLQSGETDVHFREALTIFKWRISFMENWPRPLPKPETGFWSSPALELRKGTPETKGHDCQMSMKSRLTLKMYLCKCQGKTAQNPFQTCL